jgi:hypothetical protein
MTRRLKCEKHSKRARCKAHCAVLGYFRGTTSQDATGFVKVAESLGRGVGKPRSPKIEESGGDERSCSSSSLGVASTAAFDFPWNLENITAMITKEKLYQFIGIFLSFNILALRTGVLSRYTKS